MASRPSSRYPRASSRGSHSHQFDETAALVPASGSRVTFILILFSLVALVGAGRLAYLSLIAGPDNAAEAIASRTQTIQVEAKRGTIYDRNGKVLATTIDATTIYCNPSEVTDPEGDANLLAGELGGAASDYIDALSKSDSSFAYVYRKADKDTAARIKDMKLAGIYFLADSKRVYPYGQVAGQVIGLCDVDGKGVSGLELYYDETLAGTSGEMRIERGGNGYAVAGGLTEVRRAQDGKDIVVSLDVDMQERLETRLTEEVSELSGKRGDALLYDGATGEVIACASTPYLNPGDRSSVKEGSTSLMPVSVAYEPGSIFKGVTMAAILEAGVLSPESELYCPSSLPADEYTVTDAHDRVGETMTLTQILARSSNIGTSLAAKQLGFRQLYHKIQAYGLTEATGIDFPGESAGYCTDVSTWSTIQSYNVSFGQGLTVTPLQMARFYGALANGGVAYQPHFLLSGNTPDSQSDSSWEEGQIFENTEALAPLEGMLQEVVAKGTGKKAQIEGFKPAGKTGTAQYTDNSGRYASDRYNISFIGYIPASTSKLVCFVGVTEVPGDASTASAFKDIMSFAINRYKITAQ